MGMTRRQLLRWTTTLGIASTVVGSIQLYSWWDTDPEAPFVNLNTLEASVVRAVGRGSFPSGETIDLDGGEANLDRFFDTLLTSMTDENRVLLKLLLEAVERTSLVSHGSFFTSLSPTEQQHCIETWLGSSNTLFRGAIQSLVVLLGIGYTAHPTASTHLSKYFRCGFGA